MTLQNLLAKLHAAGVRLRNSEGQLAVSGQRDRLDGELLEALRGHKADLLELLAEGGSEWWTPPPAITPEMLPLVSLTQVEIDRIVAEVPGGARNVQDIYPLAPLQEGILFHHLMAEEGDPYLLASTLAFDSRGRLQEYLDALQAVADRHDILRTAVLWEGLTEPVQVVWRAAPIPVQELTLDTGDGDVAAQLHARFHPRRHRIDLTRAPLLRLHFAHDAANDRWVLLELMHHMVDDNTSLRFLHAEIRAHLEGRTHELPAPLPFRNYVAQTRMGAGRAAHEAYFRALLGDVDEPTAPFGLLDAWGDGSGLEEARLVVDPVLAGRLRARAQALGVSAASVFHLAWGQVLARATGRDDVVFGTVLFGRMQGGEGAHRVLGPFINTLPVRARLDAGVEASVRAMHGQLAELLVHEHASLALAQRASGVRAPAPLFTSLLNYRRGGGGKKGAAAPGSAPGGALGGVQPIFSEERTNYPVALSVDDGFEGGFRLQVQTPAAVGAERVCAMVHRALESLVEALETAPGRETAALDVLPEAERRTVVEAWNATDAPYPADRCIHHLFQAQVERTPGAAAVVFEGEPLTYAQLNARANRLAHHLAARGVGPDAAVAVCAERSPEMVVALLAVLKAGGAYVPLDPEAPEERLRAMLADSAPAVLLTQEALRGRFDGVAIAVLAVDTDAPAWAAAPETNPDTRGLTPDHLAYVIYTSGSTGTPKGVMNAHRGVVNRLAWMDREYRLGAGEAVLQKTPYTFDVSVWELFWPLLTGARLVMARPGGHRDPAYLADTVVAEGITTLHFVPSMLPAFLDADGVEACASTLRRVVCSGEALPAALVRRFHERLPATELHNLYGPTEAAVDVTAWPCAGETADVVPIGRPMANVRIYLLDARMAPVPAGVPGELYIGGIQVARGYLNRAGLTAERFVPDPFGARPGARLYRTGDLARWMADGSIEYLGRNDFQVKVRGFRIEPGEIEARLAEHPAVREAVVMAREDGSGEKRLVAWIVADEADGPDAEALRAHLSARLPEYMVPAAYVRLEALPLTSSGKLDRRALPGPDGDAYARRGYEAPGGEVETALAEIWGEVLEVERVGRHDHFFALGGHSLLVVRVVERMRQRGLHSEVRALLATPVLSEFAREVSRESTEVQVPPNAIPAGCEAITPAMLPLVELTRAEIDRVVAEVPGGAANVQDIYPLAPLQEGIFFHHLRAAGHDPYLNAQLMDFDTRERLDAFLVALQAVVDRHDVLRTSVAWQGVREPVQVVWRRAVLPVEEVVLDPARGDAAGQLWERFDPRDGRLDLGQAPMMRCFVAADPGEERWVLLWWVSHLVHDHASLDALVSELAAHLEGRAHALPPARPYRDHVARVRLGTSRQEHERFFGELLGDVTEPTVPFAVLEAQGDGTGVAEAPLPVDAGLSRRVRARAQALGVSAASVFHLAWAQVLARVSGREDVVFGTVLFGRTGSDADQVMGLLINTLPMRLRVGAEGAAAGVRATHALLSELLRHEHASLALAQRCSGVAAPTPLFTALLNYRHGAEKKPARPGEAPGGMAGIRAIAAQERTNYPLMLSVDDAGEGFQLTAQGVAGIDPQRVCALMHRALERLVDALETAPATALRELDVLPEAERRLVVEEWNRTEAGYPRDACIHELFRAQAARTPQAVALSWRGERWTYAELEARANRISNALRRRGVGPEVRVGICLPRTPELLAAMLGALGAGGAYVPLDPAYPRERLGYLLEDARIALVVTDSAFADRLPEGAPALLLLDGDRDAIAAESADAPESGAVPENLSHVIFTSGSTGRPKGVMIRHSSVVVLLHWLREIVTDRERSSVLFSTSINFDVSVAEIFGTLCWGGTLVMVENALELATLGEEVVHASMVPSAAAELLKSGGIPASVKTLNLAGEALPSALAQGLYALGTVEKVGNVYGPTEDTTYSTYHLVPRGADRVLIGRPMANTQAYVLDAQLQPVPIGVAGELHLAGDGLSLGYVSRPAMTAERFLPCPFGAPGGRMYRTMDRVRRRADGELEYLGRTDFQVKVRGFRIEPGEIEARLAEHPGVRAPVVLVREDAPGDRRLVAYYLADEPVAVDALKSHLADRLPGYMVPAAYVWMEAYPLAPNGKLDRRALPAPEGDSYARSGYEAPVGETEEDLAEIWRELLGVERVGRRDDFFELGGHSLLVVQAISRIREVLDVKVEPGEMFERPVLASLAEWILHLQLAQFDPDELARLAGSIGAPA